MRTRKKELDVDFIGDVKPLTKQEEKRISDVIKMLKVKKSTTLKPTRKLKPKKKVTV
jgi:hypothetical protein